MRVLPLICGPRFSEGLEHMSGRCVQTAKHFPCMLPGSAGGRSENPAA